MIRGTTRSGRWQVLSVVVRYPGIPFNTLGTSYWAHR
jgi:hypothetical protein